MMSNPNGLLTVGQPRVSSASPGLKSTSLNESGDPTSATMNGNASVSDVGLPLRSASAGHAEVVKMNLMTIRRVDSEVVSIVSTVPRVMLYKYEEGANTWVSSHSGAWLTGNWPFPLEYKSCQGHYFAIDVH